MTSSALTQLSASLEDYLEAILHLSAGVEVARAKDIAVALNVARPSVTGALKILAKKDLVNYKPYGYVTLTAAGTAAAKRVARKHDIIKSFFVDVLGVEDAVAHDAACKAEHALGSQIVRRLGEFSDFVGRRDNGLSIAEQFRNFRQKGGRQHG